MSLKKGWFVSSLVRLLSVEDAGREGGRAHVWEMHNAKMGFQSRLSPEYPTGTHGAFVDRFCTGRMLLKLLPILGTPTNSYDMKMGLLTIRAHGAVYLHKSSKL